MANLRVLTILPSRVWLTIHKPGVADHSQGVANHSPCTVQHTSFLHLPDPGSRS
jgi:hypothetical protein